MRWTFANILCFWIGFSAPAHADPVADWNRIAIDTAMHSGRTLEYNLRAVAMVHVAMLEAANFIEKRYQPHFVLASTSPTGNAGQAAAVSAAHHMLVSLYPSQAARLDAALNGSAARPDERTGQITGANVAALIRAVSDSPIDAPASDIHFGTSPLTWNARVAELVSARGLSPIEAARIHALVSTAIAESYAHARRSGASCAPCIANPAVVSILEDQLGAQLSLIAQRETAENLAAGRLIARQAMARYRPISPEASSPAPAR